MPLTLRASTTLALGAVLVLASTAGANALDLGVSAGGIDVGVSVGGESGVGVDIGGGGLGVDIDVDLDGDGVPDTSSSGAGVQRLGQEGALQAVKSNRALPLEDILTRARLVANGEIIDAQLIQVRRILLYEIKVLGRSGDVSELYFYARSGALVAQK
jgi:hypothetical protein